MSNHQSESAASADNRDEVVSLADLWLILVDRRWLIIATVLVFVAAGLGYLFMKAPIYDAGARIRIGQVAGTGFIETVDVLSSRLMATYGEAVATGVKRPRPFLVSASAPRGVTGVIDLVAEGDTPGDAVAVLERIVVDIKAVHDDVHRGGVPRRSVSLRRAGPCTRPPPCQRGRAGGAVPAGASDPPHKSRPAAGEAGRGRECGPRLMARSQAGGCRRRRSRMKCVSISRNNYQTTPLARSAATAAAS